MRSSKAVEVGVLFFGLEDDAEGDSVADVSEYSQNSALAGI